MAQRRSPMQRNLRTLAVLALLIVAVGLAVFALTRPASPAPTHPASPAPTRPASPAPTRPASPAPTHPASPAATRPTSFTPTPHLAPSPQPPAPTPPSPAPGGLLIATPLPGDPMRTIRLDQLPAEAHDTLRLIAAGGPFPYRQDGVVFENREGRLPRKPAGYYREYTVVTPGSADRGARRLVRGNQGELYYTDDHYNSFRRVIP